MSADDVKLEALVKRDISDMEQGSTYFRGLGWNEAIESAQQAVAAARLQGAAALANSEQLLNLQYGYTSKLEQRIEALESEGARQNDLIAQVNGLYLTGLTCTAEQLESAQDRITALEAALRQAVDALGTCGVHRSGIQKYDYSRVAHAITAGKEALK